MVIFNVLGIMEVLEAPEAPSDVCIEECIAR